MILLQMVLVTLLATIVCSTEDYDQDPTDYSNQDNSAVASESNEVYNASNAVVKRKRSRTEQTTITYKDVENTERDDVTSSIPSQAPTYALPNCDKQFQPTDKSDEDRCTSTLVNYPFSVSIQRKGAHYATGALLDKRWILSVAREFFNVRESIKLLRARLGSVDCKKGGTLVPLKRVEIHPSYLYGKPNFDLALLRMAQPVDYTDYIRPIGLSKIKTKVLSAKFMTTYWPRLIIKGQVLPTSAKERIKQNSMRVSTQRLIPREKCLEGNMKNLTLDESTLCLKPVITHHSICMPDAGAPVVAEDGLWGITSGWITDQCVKFPSPTVFSRLSSTTVRSWLDTQLLTI